MQQGQQTNLVSDEEQEAMHRLWVEKITEVLPLREAHQEALKTNPKNLRSFRHEKLEATISYLSNKLAPAWNADIDAEIKAAAVHKKEVIA